MRRFRAFLGVLLALSCSASFATAGRLAYRVFRSADGLPDDGIRRIARDSRGFLWFCTAHGLARFDGRRFTAFTTKDGLPEESVTDFLETKGGAFLVATADGVYRFDPRASGRPFSRIDQHTPGEAVRVVVEDAAGTVWAGGSVVRRVIPNGEDWTEDGEPVRDPGGSPIGTVTSLLAEAGGALWIGTRAGLFRVAADGRVQRFGTDAGLPYEDIATLAFDRDGRLWIGTTLGPAVAVSPDGSGRTRFEPVVGWSPKDDGWPRAILPSEEGELWVATGAGMRRILPMQNGRGPSWQLGPVREGLPHRSVWALAEDAHGNLWAGTEADGAMRFNRDRITVFAEAEGIENPRIATMYQDDAGEVLAIDGDRRVYRLDEGMAERFTLPVPETAWRGYWAWNRTILEDRPGDWWLPTAGGLYRFLSAPGIDALSRENQVAPYADKRDLAGGEPWTIFEDSRGDLWVSTSGTGPALHRRRAGSRVFEHFGPESGLPHWGALDFEEDRSGNVWFGFYGHGLARFDPRTGDFRVFSESDGLPDGSVGDLHLDRDGRLWLVAARGGVARIDAPASSDPRIVRLGMEEGLSSVRANCIAEDRTGRIYFGTDRGVDRLDPASGLWRRFGTEDGLPNSFVQVAMTDRDGRVWFGTLGGVAMLAPFAERRDSPPPTFIDTIRVGGVPRPISRLGESAPAPFQLPRDSGMIEIGYGALDFGGGAPLLFQYRFASLDRDWSQPAAERSVRFEARPGRYRLLVRAVDPQTKEVGEAAEVNFDIPLPFYQRRWFVAVSLISVVIGALGAARVRERLHARRHEALQRIVDERTRDLAGANATLEALNRDLEQRVEDGIASLREAERAAAYGRIAAGVAHEVRHPLFALQSTAYVLKRRLGERPDLDRQIRILDMSTRRMGHLMDDLLEFARPSALKVGPEDPGDIAREALDIHLAEHGDDPPRPEIRLGVDVPRVNVDRARLVQVLVNLLENARKHARGATSIVVAVDRAPVAEGVDLVSLAVQDDGPGIPPEHLPRVFDAFYTTGAGTGLGLAIVRRVVEEHGGRVTVESGETGGACFRILLPAAGGAAPDSGGRPEERKLA